MEVALGRTAAVALAVTVFAFACGSTIVNRVLVDGRPARWVCLFVLLGLALAYASVARPARLPPVVAGLVGALAAVAFASTLWSVDPMLTLKRATSFAALLATGAALVAATRGREEAVRRLLLGLLAGALAVALAGLVVLAFDWSSAVQSATTEYPARYRGFGQNPNTAAMLLAVATPLALLALLEARRRAGRAAALAVLLLFAGSLAGSGARGPMLGALAGSFVLLAARGGERRRTIPLVGVAVMVFVACVAVSRIPDAKSLPAGSSQPPHAVPRTLFTSSGRSGAWRDAIEEAADRPVAGYGFGTEEIAFVNRYPGFVSDLPENSYIGAALQLGLAGLTLLVAIVLSVAALLVRARRRPVAAACAGAVAAALTVAITQSYLFSVGNIATVSAWICLFLLAAAVEWPQAGGAAASSPRISSSETRTSQSG